MSNYLLAGGGTGGHIYPGFAVAERILELDPTARVDFACTPRPIDSKILRAWPGKVLVQPTQPFAARPLGLVKFAVGLWRTKRVIRRWFHENHTVAVLGLGGFGSGAAVREAARLGLRSAFLNPDFVPGRANRWLGKRAGKIFVQFEGTQQYFARPVDAVGVPLRKDICSLPERSEALRQFGLRGEKRTLVVVGGSTGARSLNSAVVKVLDELKDQMAAAWQVLFITGAGDFDRIKALVTDRNFGNLDVTLLPYSDRMDLAWSAADLAVCRAGAITVAELTAAGVPSILLPYPYHRDNHQAKNGQVLVDAGAAVLVHDDKEAGERTREELRRALTGILFDEARRSAMIKGAETLRRIDAAQIVARWLVGK